MKNCEGNPGGSEYNRSTLYTCIKLPKSRLEHFKYWKIIRLNPYEREKRKRDRVGGDRKRDRETEAERDREKKGGK